MIIVKKMKTSACLPEKRQVFILTEVFLTAASWIYPDWSDNGT